MFYNCRICLLNAIHLNMENILQLKLGTVKSYGFSRRVSGSTKILSNGSKSLESAGICMGCVTLNLF